MQKGLAPPDLLIILRCSIRGIRRRIKKRGRANEQAIPLTYIRKLNDLYDDWFQRWDQSRILEINTEDLDYISDFVHRFEVQRVLAPFLT